MTLFYSFKLYTPLTGGSGSCIYFPKEQDSLVISPGIGLRTELKSHIQGYVTADRQLTSLCWSQAPTWNP
jgi:hypothetical protein